MKIGRGNQRTWGKPAPVPLCPPQIPHDQTQAQTWAAMEGSQLAVKTTCRMVMNTKNRWVWNNAVIVASTAHHFTSKSPHLVNSFATHQSIPNHKISAISLDLNSINSPINELSLCGTARQKYEQMKSKKFSEMCKKLTFAQHAKNISSILKIL
jgi:hypothetical protein